MVLFSSFCCLSSAERPKSQSTDKDSPGKETLPVYLREERSGEVPIITLVPPDGREALLFQPGKLPLRPAHGTDLLV